ncbi:MAG TPA: LacI family DNA-binding transcriptional regulator [Pedococcus sp.]|nr:LacI family DNA-binding transcriptional regulator [Pedococcus sp.]
MASTTGVSRERPTIINVAQAAGVSRQTVSNALNNPERVAPSTLERVHAAIEQLGFTPNAAAQHLRRQRAQAYGFEVNPSGMGRMGHILDGFLVELTVAAPGHQSHLVTFAPELDHLIEGYERILTSGLVDGFFLGDTRRDDPRPGWLLENAVPFVTFGRIWDRPDLGRWVDVDGRAGMELAVRHLAEQGYDDIAYLGWPAGSPVGDDRRRGWLAGLAGLDLTSGLLAEEAVQDLDAASAAAERLLTRLDRSGTRAAILCASDLLALGVLRAARDRGLSPGTDLGVVGFDDSDVAEAVGLTSLRQPLREAAEHAWRILHVPGADVSATALLAPTLTVRASSTPTPSATRAHGIPTTEEHE